MLCRPCRPWTMPPTVCPMNDRSADNRPDGGPPSRPCRGRSPRWVPPQRSRVSCEIIRDCVTTSCLASTPRGNPLPAPAGDPDDRRAQAAGPRGSARACPGRVGPPSGYLPFFFGWPGRDLYPPFDPLCGMKIASFLGWRLLQHDHFDAGIVRIIVAINEQMAATARAAGGDERVGLAGAAARRGPGLDFRAMELARLLALFDRFELIGARGLGRNRAAGHQDTFLMMTSKRPQLPDACQKPTGGVLAEVLTTILVMPKSPGRVGKPFSGERSTELDP